VSPAHGHTPPGLVSTGIGDHEIEGSGFVRMGPARQVEDRERALDLDPLVPGDRGTGIVGGVELDAGM